MKMSKMLMIAAILMVADRPALAEQGWADSPDFTVNAVPEPVAAALFVLGIRFAPIGYSLFVMRRRAKREKRGIRCCCIRGEKGGDAAGTGDEGEETGAEKGSGLGGG